MKPLAPALLLAAALLPFTAFAAPAAGEGLKGLVVARGACVVAESYAAGAGAATRFPVYSVAKSVLSLLVGAAIDKGRLRLDETLAEALPETKNPGADPRLAQIRVEDLLTMTAGFPRPSPKGGVDPQRVLSERLADAPGQRFQYGGEGPVILVQALSRALHSPGSVAARETLFAPLHIQDYRWKADAAGRLSGDTDLELSVRDMAKMGLLVLNHGGWKGRPLVSAAYIDAATSPQSAGGPPANAAYGYLWWAGRTPAGDAAAFAYGIHGQSLYVVPAQQLVIAVAADDTDDFGLRLAEALAARGIAKDAPCLADLEKTP